MRLARTQILTVIGGALALGFGGAAAYAAIPSADGTISACYAKSNGSIRIVDSADSCKSNETRLTWNQQGVPGPPGAPGAPGQNGTDGTDGTDGADGKDGASITAANIYPAHNASSYQTDQNFFAQSYCDLGDKVLGTWSEFVHAPASDWHTQTLNDAEGREGVLLVINRLDPDDRTSGNVQALCLKVNQTSN